MTAQVGTDWTKLGRLVSAPGGGLMHSHAMLPTPYLLDDRIRVYFTACDESLRGRIFYADLSRKPPYTVLHLETRPVMNLGMSDRFDADGVNPSQVLVRDGVVYLYYIGWKRLDAATPYTLFTGLAVSNDGGLSFKPQDNPILPPTPTEPFFRTAPCVYREGTRWAMLYIGGGQFFDGPDGKRLPIYSLRRVYSEDGFRWSTESEELLVPNTTKSEIGFGRPVLWHGRDGRPNLILSVRMVSGYQLSEASWPATQQGVFEFKDMLHKGPEAWDSEMTCFGAPIRIGNRDLLFYNGNGFGRTGFGLAWRPAQLESDHFDA